MTQAIATMRKQTLHISHSQLFTYLNCGLKFWFQYVQGVTDRPNGAGDDRVNGARRTW